jgi:hypothetical protein
VGNIYAARPNAERLPEIEGQAVGLAAPVQIL